MPDIDINQPSEEQPTLPPREPGSNESDSIASEQPTLMPGIASPSSDVSFPNIDHYEFISELGRGGMGVVYKARDTRLDRTVALKMIIAGKFASAEEIQRFRIEGEAAARLDHPGIVPVYEIEEVEGNHFFSMKFVEGDSLQNRLGEYQADLRKACELLVKISDAVQHAHQRQVLHRDLKPANVLIDLEGQPWITDFGLAKRIDGDSQLTQTGLIMGTPGFMAPEQAAGDKDITTAADVFSLGAMLYWLVTGEAPFQGDTGIQAVMDTIECNVPSLRSKVPGVSTDLDLICQKAMNKDPAQRYNSAAELANDLQSWLDGGLLSVRAPSAIDVASVWVRKNLRTVLGAGFAGVLCGVLVGSIIAFGELRGAAEQEAMARELDVGSTSWVSYFDWLRNTSSYWQALQFLTVPFIAASAFVCVLLVRPRNRETNIIAAVTCGLAAWTMTFLSGGGWESMKSSVIRPADQDIELLSSAVWLESDAERKLMQDALLRRYPGLQDMNLQQRQQRLRSKIQHDQNVGLLPGMWSGFLTSLLFTGLPLAITCVLSGLLWQDGIRGWEWFGSTWERAAYCLIFFLVFWLWLKDIPPATGLVLISMASLAFALFVAVSVRTWYWRIAMIPIPFLCMYLVNNDVGKMRSANYNAGMAVSDSEFNGFLKLNERLVDHTASSYRRYATAVGALHLGDEERYLRHCEKLLASFENAHRPEIGSRLAKVILLAPELHDSGELARVYELTEYASSFESEPMVHWFYATRALAELRRGMPAESLRWNRKCREADADRADGYMIAMSHMVDALSYLEAKQQDKAAVSAELGRRLSHETRETAMNSGRDSGWCNWLVFLILEREYVQKKN